MPTVRVTMLEDPFEVDEPEVGVLRAQGILREVDGVPEPGHEPPASEKKER